MFFPELRLMCLPELLWSAAGLFGVQGLFGTCLSQQFRRAPFLLWRCGLLCVGSTAVVWAAFQYRESDFWDHCQYQHQQLVALLYQGFSVYNSPAPLSMEVLVADSWPNGAKQVLCEMNLCVSWYQEAQLVGLHSQSGPPRSQSITSFSSLPVRLLLQCIN